MTSDILSIITSIILFIIAILVAVIILEIAFKIISLIISETYGILSVSLNLLGIVIKFVLTIMCSCIIVTGASWLLFPNNLYLELNTSNHEFEMGAPSVEFSGIYEDTHNGYILKPNLPSSLALGFPITKKDNAHINIIGLNFVEKQYDGTKNPHIISNPNGVYTFVPDKG